MDQSNRLIAPPKKNGLVKHPQLINMKQNKCPSFRMVGCSLQGVLAQAKNSDELFWEEKFHATNGKALHLTNKRGEVKILHFAHHLLILVFLGN
jgi:hypothetical protein